MASTLSVPRGGDEDWFGSQQALVVLAHRGPVRFAARDGSVVAERNAGGLVTALSDVARNTETMRWFCAASSAEDRRIARRRRWTNVPLGDATCAVRMLEVEARAHHDFYAVIANPLLWFIQHNMWGQAMAGDITAAEWDAWSNGYVAVNRQFARALTNFDDVPPHSVVMVQDYHFDLVPEMLRTTRPDLFVHHFTHIPWPQPDAWRVLPPAMREAIFHGLLGSDIVGFHTTRYVRNFLLGCEEIVGAAVDFSRGVVHHDGREVMVRSYPISVDPAALRELVASPEVSARREEIATTRREKLIVRVDRTDPAKNVVRGFHAYASMLQNHPELHGRVTFLALLQPSRQDISQYAAYLAEISDVVASVNARFGQPDWQPIDLRLADDLPMAVAAYTEFDVLVVNPVCDGMNLVAKEGLLVNEVDGVLALSESAGAHAELGAIALTVHPFDIEQQARTLYDALTMAPAERRVRREVGAEIVCNNDVKKWLERQLIDIESRRPARAARLARQSSSVAVET